MLGKLVALDTEYKFLCFYRAQQDNSCEVDEASNLHGANVLVLLF